MAINSVKQLIEALKAGDTNVIGTRIYSSINPPPAGTNAGSSGTSGSSGSSGSSGAGTSGTSGSSGTKGTSGTSGTGA
jgi:hypothetical protein